MNFYFGMGGTPISLRQKLRMQRERMQCAGLWPVVLNVLNSYIDLYKKSRRRAGNETGSRLRDFCQNVSTG